MSVRISSFDTETRYSLPLVSYIKTTPMWTVLLSTVMPAFPLAAVGGVEAPIVAHGLAGLFAPRPRVSCTAAGRFVSSLYQGAAHAGRCVRLVVQRAVGFFIHGGSVVAGTPLINAEISAVQGVGR